MIYFGDYLINNVEACQIVRQKQAMSLRFQNNELERSYAVHYRTHRARSDSMGMLFDVSLWIAAVS